MQEIWKPITGYEGHYEISNFGRVKSLARIRIIRGDVVTHLRERILRPTLMTIGYYKMALCRDGIVAQCYIHRLVAEAFVPNPMNLPQVNHLDSCRANNYWFNLEWTTSAGDAQHKTDNGRAAKGSQLPQSKLTPAKVRRIRAEHAAGATQASLARRYGIHPGTIWPLLQGKTWKHVV